MDLNEAYTLLVVIEKAAAHGTRYQGIISAAQVQLDAMLAEAHAPAETPVEAEDGA